MSNRAVSATYRTIIDDVIANVRQDFEDMGIEKEVLDELQRSWEAKIVTTGVADFEGATPFPPRRRQQNQQRQNASGSSSSEKGKVKQEDGIENGDAESSSHKRVRLNGEAAHDGDATNGDGATGIAPSQINPLSVASLVANGTVAGRTNGTSDGDAEDANGNKRKRPNVDDDEIGSDLDDSDEDEMEGNVDADGNEDMILCLYDKVQRVRNKWKCILKDGIASIDGRDYVFSKLSSELEW